MLEYRYDTVKVRDGEKHYSQLLSPSGGFSGVRFASLEASSNVMWIQFSSDSTFNQQGFNLTYRAIGKAGQETFFSIHLSLRTSVMRILLVRTTKLLVPKNRQQQFRVKKILFLFQPCPS